MKKLICILVIIITMIIAGVAAIFINNNKNKDENKEEENNEIQYTNLIDESKIKELSELLDYSGVNKNNSDKVISSIKQYNQTIGNEILTNNGIIELSSPIPKYDDIKIDEMWSKKNDMFIGYNCRLTAFELMKDFIAIKDLTKSNPSALFMDQDALDNSNDNYLTKEELEKYEALYSTIVTTNSTDTNEQYKKQKEYWDSIGVEFNNNDKISLISVYIHNHFSEDENELIIGHTGILINTGKDYMFFEKLSFQLPYQMIRFNSKSELKQYLMNAYDTDTTNESAKPFILENNSLM